MKRILLFFFSFMLVVTTAYVSLSYSYEIKDISDYTTTSLSVQSLQDHIIYITKLATKKRDLINNFVELYKNKIDHYKSCPIIDLCLQQQIDICEEANRSLDKELEYIIHIQTYLDINPEKNVSLDSFCIEDCRNHILDLKNNFDCLYSYLKQEQIKTWKLAHNYCQSLYEDTHDEILIITLISLSCALFSISKCIY